MNCQAPINLLSEHVAVGSADGSPKHLEFVLPGLDNRTATDFADQLSQDLFNHSNNAQGKVKIFGVIGRQKIGKSTASNKLFGLQDDTFHVGHDDMKRTTNGVQAISVALTTEEQKDGVVRAVTLDFEGTESLDKVDQLVQDQILGHNATPEYAESEIARQDAVLVLFGILSCDAILWMLRGIDREVVQSIGRSLCAAKRFIQNAPAPAAPVAPVAPAKPKLIFLVRDVGKNTRPSDILNGFRRTIGDEGREAMDFLFDADVSVEILPIFTDTTAYENTLKRLRTDVLGTYPARFHHPVDWCYSLVDQISALNHMDSSLMSIFERGNKFLWEQASLQALPGALAKYEEGLSSVDVLPTLAHQQREQNAKLNFMQNAKGPSHFLKEYMDQHLCPTIQQKFDTIYKHCDRAARCGTTGHTCQAGNISHSGPCICISVNQCQCARGLHIIRQVHEHGQTPLCTTCCPHNCAGGCGRLCTRDHPHPNQLHDCGQTKSIPCSYAGCGSRATVSCSDGRGSYACGRQDYRRHTIHKGVYRHEREGDGVSTERFQIPLNCTYVSHHRFDGTRSNHGRSWGVDGVDRDGNGRVTSVWVQAGVRGRGFMDFGPGAWIESIISVTYDEAFTHS